MNDKSKTPSKSSGPGGFDPELIAQHRKDSERDDGQNPGRRIPDVPLAKHVNHTPFWSQYYQSVDAHGEVFHTMVTRISYDMRTVPRGEAGGLLGYAADKAELAMGDVFADPDQPQQSELLWESDFCAYKPKCDVFVINAASRPSLSEWQRSISIHRNPDLVPRAKRWGCAVMLDWKDEEGQKQHWHKRLDVTGPRQVGVLGGTSEPKEASEVVLGWHKAFGGPGDERNPLGVGHASSKSDRAPQQEEGGKAYRGGILQGGYPPAGLGPVGKAWLPRRTKAGTYDNAWLKDQWPLPPHDFDYAYWNCAPEDQQIDYPTPGAEISLVNLWPPLQEGQKPPPGNAKTEIWRGRLPMHQLFVRLLGVWRNPKGKHQLVKRDHDMNLDTLIVNMRAQRVDACYRLCVAHSELSEMDFKMIETCMNPVGQPDKPVPNREFGPLG